MLRRSLAAVVVVLVVGSFVFAETVRGIVTKISDSEVEITVRKDKEDKEGTKKTYKITKDTKEGDRLTVLLQRGVMSLYVAFTVGKG